MNETLRIGLLVIAIIIITNPKFKESVKLRFDKLIRKWNKPS